MYRYIIQEFIFWTRSHFSLLFYISKTKQKCKDIVIGLRRAIRISHRQPRNSTTFVSVNSATSLITVRKDEITMTHMMIFKRATNYWTNEQYASAVMNTVHSKSKRKTDVVSDKCSFLYRLFQFISCCIKLITI